ncbi:MAG TPA: AMP-binding protein [Burkholderiales bacterium]|nr:AMP-binding protein [Burkholderiales bacterium]
MARGLTRQQIGVTEAMIQTFGETVFRLSHNYQVRRGDPIRRLQFDEIEEQRAALGLTDAQIAERIGLSRNQVLYIRTVLERRRFRTGHYVRLLELGGGKRFRAERHTPHLDHFRFSEQALALRAAMNYAPERARLFVDRGWWRDDTLAKWLERHATTTPDAPAIRSGDTVIRYGELARKVGNLAAALAELGIARGEVVSVQLPNLPEFLIAYLAITGLGAVMSTIHMPYRATEIETLLAHARSRAVICLSKAGDFPAARVMLGLKAKLPLLDHVIALGAPVEGALSLAELIAHDRDAALLDEPPVASDPFLLLFTSGTTSAPKAVPLSYHNMLSNARLGAPEHGLSAGDVILSAAPFTHLFGLYSVHVAMAVGASNLLLPAFTPPELAATIERGQPSALWTAPAHVAACIGSGLFDHHDLSSLKLSIVSGSACPPELARAFAARAKNCAVTQLWGMTETQGALYTRPGDPLDVSAATAGRPSPGTEVRIVDVDENAVPPGTEGELQVRGCLLFPGYLDNPAANAAAFAADGWFRTGDLAVQDAAGNVRISGRIKDVINRGGVKYNPLDIELLLDKHPKVAQSAIVPVPDPVLGEKACAFVVPKPGTEVTLRELCDYLSQHDIAKIKLPERLEIIAEMPLTPTRKIIKGRLKPETP